MKTRNTLRLGFSARNLTRGALLAALVCLLPTQTHAQTPVQAWVQSYCAPGRSTATAMVVDSSNNVIVTGYSDGGQTAHDYATIKYSSAGVPLWTNRYNGPGNRLDLPHAMTVDASNNVIVTGSADGGGIACYATIKYSSTGVPLWTNLYSGGDANAVAVDRSNNVIVTGVWSSGGSASDYATIKYSSAGAPLWTNRYNGPGDGDDTGYAVAVDTNDNVIVTGISATTSVFPYDDAYATIKYSSAGVPLWTNRYLGPGKSSIYGTSLALDASGTAFVTGTSAGIGSSWDYATVAYSTAGVPLWTNRYNGTGNGWDYANAVALGSSGNVIVTGESPNATNNDYVTIAYSYAGVPLWTNRYSGPGNGSDAARAVAVDPSGNVVVTGSSEGAPFNEDYVTISYSSSGVPLWTNRYNGPGNDTDAAVAVAVDHNGNVIVTGTSVNGTTIEYTTIKYSVVQRIPIKMQLVEHQLVLTWTNRAFTLQCAPAVTGTFTNIPGATSPCTNPMIGDQRFFRLISN